MVAQVNFIMKYFLLTYLFSSLAAGYTGGNFRELSELLKKIRELPTVDYDNQVDSNKDLMTTTKKLLSTWLWF